MSYVPPALRRKQEAVARGEKLSDEATGSEVSLVDSANQLPTVTDVQNHFWPPQKADSSTSRPSGAAGIPDSPAIARRESNQAFDGTANTVDDGKTEPDGSTSVVSKSNLPHLHSTLNGTRAEPDRLKYVLLFHQAHPRWPTEQIIYVKSELQLLPQPPSQGQSQPSSTSPENQSSLSDVPFATEIMMFEQTSSERIQSRARFTFLGYFDLMKMQVLEPNTPELTRMLEQKWTKINKWGQSRQIQRDADSWKKSLSYRWAVLKFKKSTVQLEPPKIEVTTNDMGIRKENLWSDSRKGVNEMLRDMRIKDSKDEKEKCALTGWHAVADTQATE